MNFLQKIKDRLDLVRPFAQEFINIELFSQLNTTITHFIYELIQNAEDAHSSLITIQLEKDRLIFSNNGKCFTESNTKSLIKLGYSDKGEEDIGKFGIGFKSVFSVSECPEVYSGKLSFRFLKQLEIEAIESESYVKGSRFVIPFDEERHPVNETFEFLKKELEEIDPLVIMFLKHIREIKWQTDDAKGTISKSDRQTIKSKTGQLAKSIRITSSVSKNESSNDSDKIDLNFLVFKSFVSENIGETRDNTVNIVFNLSDDGKSVLPLKKMNIFSFLPTKQLSHTSFIVQAPFDLVKSRESLLETSKKNPELWNALNDLFGESIRFFSSEGFVDLDFLNMMPFETHYFIPENNFLDTFKEIVSNIPLIPTQEGGFAYPSEAAIPMTSGIENVFSNEDIEECFGSEKLFGTKKWMAGEINIQEYNDVRNFLIDELNITKISLHKIFLSWNHHLEWFSKKPMNWFKTLYAFLYHRQAFWSIKEISIKHINIILSSKKQLVAPFDSNEDPNIFLPGQEKVRYEVVNQKLFDDENCKKFFTRLGLKSISKLDEIRNEVIPRYKSGPEPEITSSQYKKDVTEIVSYWSTAEENDKKKLEKNLGRANIIRTKNAKGKIKFVRPEQCYLDTKEIKEYFSNYDDHFLVNIPKNKNENKFRTLIMNLDVSTVPKVIEFERAFTEFDISTFNFRYTDKKNIIDRTIEGLEECLVNLDKKKSVILLKFLGLVEYDWRWGQFNYFYRYNNRHLFDSYALSMLKESAWLYDKKGDRVRPKDIMLEELHIDYFNDTSDISRFSKVLDFKPSVTQVSAWLNDIHDATKDFSEEQKNEALSLIEEIKKKNIKSSESKKDDFEVDDFKIFKVSVNKPSTETIKIKETENKVEQETTELENTGNNASDNSASSNKIDNAVKKARGREAEGALFNNFLNDNKKKKGFLEQDGRFSFESGNSRVEYRWLNWKREQSNPYDIVRKRNDEFEEYIEVKSKIKRSQKWVDLSKNEWDFAEQLYQQNNGDQYILWIMNKKKRNDIKFDATPYKNPVKSVEEGSLVLKPDSYRIHFG